MCNPKHSMLDFFKKKKNRIIYIAIIFLSLVFGSELKSQGLNNSFSKYKDLVEECIQKNSISGMQVAIVGKDSILWQENFGYANIANGLKVNDSTFFRIGSISKPFVALSLLMLQEQGCLNINDEYKNLVPEIEFNNKWEESYPLKLVHLLEHTSGFDDARPAEYKKDAIGWSTLEALNFHPSTRTSKWKPGTSMSYSNVGTTCAAYVVEKVANQTYESYVEENIFTPLGMSHSSYFKNDYISENLARGYNNGEVDYWHILMKPSGALNSNVTELSKLLQLLLNKGSYGNKMLLSPSSIHRMERVETTLAGKSGFKTGYGLCLQSTKIKDYQVFFSSWKNKWIYIYFTVFP